jgi:hypothetical protein
MTHILTVQPEDLVNKAAAQNGVILLKLDHTKKDCQIAEIGGISDLQQY